MNRILLESEPATANRILIQEYRVLKQKIGEIKQLYNQQKQPKDLSAEEATVIQTCVAESERLEAAVSGVILNGLDAFNDRQQEMVEVLNQNIQQSLEKMTKFIQRMHWL